MPACRYCSTGHVDDSAPAWTCPACAGRMIDGPESRGAWGCTQCGGVWAGMGVANQVASVLDPRVRELADVAQGFADKQRGARPIPIPRVCPECRAPLTERELGAVTVDICATHGTWFDRGELQRVSDERRGKKKPATAASKEREKEEESGFPSHRQENLAADLALGGIWLLFAFITD